MKFSEGSMPRIMRRNTYVVGRGGEVPYDGGFLLQNLDFSHLPIKVLLRYKIRQLGWPLREKSVKIWKSEGNWVGHEKERKFCKKFRKIGKLPS